MRVLFIIMLLTSPAFAHSPPSPPLTRLPTGALVSLSSMGSNIIGHEVAHGNTPNPAVVNYQEKVITVLTTKDPAKGAEMQQRLNNALGF